ncbi:uncharacterized protein M437DRAFT_60941, partial [Aureobasidium melanogenum CBS 110374]
LIKMQDEYPLQGYAQRSVLTTWKISHEQIKSQSEEASNLLQLWIFGMSFLLVLRGSTQRLLCQTG